jgi:hypothetical protein
MGEGGGSRESPTVTVEYLQEWEGRGAVWRAVRVSDDRVVIDLCSCSGEPMERVQSDEQELVA